MPNHAQPSSDVDQKPSAQGTGAAEPAPWRSRLGLSAANFFLAELTAVVMPFLGAYLMARQWSASALGVAISLTGLGALLAQEPARLLARRARHRQALLAGAALLVGICYGLIPLVVPSPGRIDSLLLAAGAAQAFFVPLLGLLALGLLGRAALHQTIGVHQSRNHAANLMAAALTMTLIHLFGLTAIFYALAAGSVLAAASSFLIDEPPTADPAASVAGDHRQAAVSFGELLRDYRVWALLASTGLYHLAGAALLPFLGAYVVRLGGSHTQVGCLVMIPQAIMIPLALAAGWSSDRWGRKWLFGTACCVLVLRTFLFSLARDGATIVAVQSLDGIGSGLYGVAIVAMCADLTRGKRGFNTLSGMIATTLAVAGVIGPLGAGLLAQHFGYSVFFQVFAGIAALSALIFLVAMPETGNQPETAQRRQLARGSSVAADKPLP